MSSRWTDDETGVSFFQFRKLFRLEEPDSRGDCYLVYLQKGRNMSGSSLLQMAERAAIVEFNAKRLYLQDAAQIHCGHDRYYDLGFRSLLSHGLTWYEMRGYKLTSLQHPSIQSESLRARRLEVDLFVRSLASFPVGRISEIVQLQVNSMRNHEPAKRVDKTLFTTAIDDCQIDQEKSQMSLLRIRVKLCNMLREAPPDATLGPWLLSLDCKSFSFFTSSMYGSREGPGFAVSEVGGFRTPSLKEFEKANWLRRNSHKLMWVKELERV